MNMYYFKLLKAMFIDFNKPIKDDKEINSKVTSFKQDRASRKSFFTTERHRPFNLLLAKSREDLMLPCVRISRLQRIAWGSAG